jgi:transposase InsO family protein
MPWTEVTPMSLRLEFVRLAAGEGANIRGLCRRYGISPSTGYKWLVRYQAGGAEALVDQSRRPERSPTRTEAAVEAQVLALRAKHPTWGGRKLAARLEVPDVPHPNTITAILRRHGQLRSGPDGPRRPWQRFERERPNQLWQMDFKGHISLGAGGGRCHPLTVLDDHSRFAVGLDACADETDVTVRGRLTRLFQRYGLPDQLLMDNGPPWGGGPAPTWTVLTVWLLRLGIGVSHGRPRHPQTQGKDERFHRTLKADLLQGRVFGDLPTAQRAFDTWRDQYNLERPHEACGLAPPVTRYQPSSRPFPDPLPPIEYPADAQIRLVHDKGEVWVNGHRYLVGKAFRTLPVALRPTAHDGRVDVFFSRHRIASIDLALHDDA